MQAFTQVDPQLVARYYPGYDGPAHVYPLQRHIMNDVLRPLVERHVPEGGLVVDLGCGSGTMVSDVIGWGLRGIGVDPNDGAFGKYPALDLRKGTIYEIPVEDGVADMATSKWVFEHLAEPAAAAAEIRRILRPAGHALIVTPNVLHPSMLMSHMLPTRVKQLMLSGNGGIEDDLVMRTYYRANTEPALDRAFGGAGFERVALSYTGDPSYWMFSRRLFRAAAAAHAVGERLRFRRLQMNIVALYRKAR